MDQVTDAKSFWRALGARAVGVAIVTARGTDGPAGFLALSATHLSADPPMMMVSIGLQTSALSAVVESRHFAINYVAKGSDDLVAQFSGKGDRKGADRFVPADWTVLSSGAPALIGSVGVIDCRLEETIERHGAVIAIGRVLAFTSSPERQPMISFAGRYI